MHIEWSHKADKDMHGFPKNLSSQIARKIQWFADQEDPLFFAEPISGAREKLYRFRIGDYRAIFTIKHKEIRILFVISVQHRSQIYKRL